MLRGSRSEENHHSSLRAHVAYPPACWLLRLSRLMPRGSRWGMHAFIEAEKVRPRGQAAVKGEEANKTRRAEQPDKGGSGEHILSASISHTHIHYRDSDTVSRNSACQKFGRDGLRDAANGEKNDTNGTEYQPSLGPSSASQSMPLPLHSITLPIAIHARITPADTRSPAHTGQDRTVRREGRQRHGPQTVMFAPRNDWGRGGISLNCFGFRSERRCARGRGGGGVGIVHKR